jgi:predicted nucleotidyltransferase
MNKEDILKVLKSKKTSYHLKNFILFGSVSSVTNTTNSDIDIAYIEDDKTRLNFENKQLNFNASVNLLIAIGEEKLM